ncbi:Glycylpeptide N-tetradecanoyltransferase 2 [Thelohanellus kitauei]|uniref:Glycylpeptide N-tetradecanoyltransferase n=1 Tax=Thelohanellus kitauei TaxID=669202 RepID=A0A0C2MYJ4_THEKT|nr:Glycylpeptide N-tetradecanoyltransferase 2 [Thelohanellus kitauei]
MRPKIQDYVRECLLPKKDVIYSYVVENAGNVTDFICFYRLETSSVHLPKNDRIKLAMLYYYAVTETPLQALFSDMIFIAKKVWFTLIYRKILMLLTHWKSCKLPRLSKT